MVRRTRYRLSRYRVRLPEGLGFSGIGDSVLLGARMELDTQLGTLI